MMKQIFTHIKNELTPKHQDTKRMYIGFAVLTVFMALSLFFQWFLWVFFAAFIILVGLFSRSVRCFYFFIFILPMRGVILLEDESLPSLFMLAFTMIVAVLMIHYVIRLIKKQEKISILHAVFLGFMIVYVFLPFPFLAITNKLGICFGLLAVYLVYVFRKEFCLREMFVVLLAGIAISMLLGLVVMLGIESFNQRFWLTHICWSINRYCALYHDPNFMAAEIVLAIAVLFTLRFNKQFKFSFYLIFTFLIACAVITASKMGLLMFVVAFGGYGLFSLTKLIQAKFMGGKKVFLHFTTILIIIGFVVLVFYSQTLDMLGRFNIELNTGEWLDNVTTYRYGIWKAYFEQSTSNIYTILFGHGLHAPGVDVFGNGWPTSTHNSFLDVFYYLGLVYFILIVLLAAILAVPFIKNKQLKLSNMLPLITMCMGIFALSFFHIPVLPVYIIFACFSMSYNTEAVSAT